ncbi:protein kinase domain-containing protein [Thermoleophilum album]|uniref:non-specific serine/threonine protein kinase n=1 Tax=Thermoleophilum album TaxID=29539 RepID=A0A1H6FID0_THEAL|nr:protein kinase [Thermoleophilum album]SEH10172.1 serine/threonine protein kinase [Thermoleophilum album]
MATPTLLAGRYRIEERIGAGGMSTVFRAFDQVLERPVAIKLLAEHLAQDQSFVARFRHEALAAARLQHPNIVQVYDSGFDPESGRHYIVMEYVEGHSCAELLRDRRKLEVAEAVAIARDACLALDYAHRAGVIHRDVKPANLLVSAATGVTKLTDFGIAKAAEQTRITQVGSVLGTAAYLSPEQARGEEVGPASDIYSLGVCVYQFLTGRLPHEYGSLTELALKQQQEEIRPITELRPEVPEELDRAVRVALARDPAARYARALDFAQALEAGLRGQVTATTAALENQATRLLAAVTPGAQEEATRVLDRGGSAPIGRSPLAAPPPPAVDHLPSTSRGKRGRRALTALALVALLGVLALAGLAVLRSTTPVQRPQPVRAPDVQTQIDGIRQFLREWSR